MADQILHESEWSETEVLRVTKSEFKGKPYIGIRIWYRDGEMMKPGKNGFTARQDGEDSANIIKALNAFIKALK